MADMTIKEVKETVGKGLEHARFELLNDKGSIFIGEMLLRFSIVPCYDCRIDTACTDGKKIYFDCEFYSQLTKGQRKFVLAHEVWHNIFLHFKRQGTRDRMLWNIATDMEINHMLKNEGMEVLADACMPDPIVAGKCAEEIYEYLKKEQEKQQKQNQKNQKNKGNSQGEDSDEDGEGDSEGDGKSSSSKSKKSQSKKPKSGNGQGDEDGEDDDNQEGGNSSPSKSKHGNQFDKHLQEGDTLDDANEKDGKWGPKGIDDDCNPSIEDVKELEDTIHEAVVSVSQNIERRQGTLPGRLSDFVKEMLKPEVNWKEALAQFVTRCFGGEHSWKRCSRHALGWGHYLPGRNTEKIKLAVAVDTSGSYLQDLPKFLGELNSILNTFGNYEVTLVQCDWEVQDVQKYSDDNPLDVKSFKMKGGGGTSFKPVFEHFRQNGEEQDFSCLIYFTDGWGDAPTYPPPYPVLWVLTSDGYEDFCNWGEKMHFKPSKEN